MSITVIIVGLYNKFIKPILIRFWNNYAVAYLKKQGAILESPKSLKFYGKTFLSISNNSLCRIGENFICHSGPLFGLEGTECKISVKENASLIIGDNCGISSVILACHHSIKIGSNVNIGGGTRIMDTNFHSIDWRVRENRNEDVKHAETKPIIIGDNVFIGARCIINKGVEIGSRSIIAAGSVVVKSIPEDCIAGGNPCKVIKSLV